MILGRVVGPLVATAKAARFEGHKLLLVRPEDAAGRPTGGDEVLAVDGVGAGVGERVLVVLEGRSAGDVMGGPTGDAAADPAPVDAAIVGIVDRVDLCPDS